MLPTAPLDFSDTLEFDHSGDSHCMCCPYDVKVSSEQLTNLALYQGKKVLIITRQNGCECEYTVKCSGDCEWKLSAPIMAWFSETYQAQKPLIQHLVSCLNQSHDLCNYIADYRESVDQKSPYIAFDFAVNRRGVNVNACQYGHPEITPLCEAVIEGELGLVKTLLKNGALIQTPTMKNKRTPLHFAVFYARNDAPQARFDIIDELLKHFPPLNWRDSHKKTPMDMAQQPDFSRALTKLQGYQQKLQTLAESSPAPLCPTAFNQQPQTFELLSLSDAFEDFSCPIFLRMSKNGWNATSDDQFTRSSQGDYVLSKAFEKGEHIEFKIASQDWSEVDIGGTDVKVNQAVHLPKESGSNNFKLSIHSSGTYHFTLIHRKSETTPITLYIELIQPSAQPSSTV